jgi:hypothetical protein
MVKAPSFQFYPADWLNDLRLRGQSFEVKGFLIDIMCLMHQNDKYGYLSKEFEETLPGLLGKDRRTLGRLLREVEDKSLLVRDIDTGELMNKRMVADESKRQQFKEFGKLGGNPKLRERVNPTDKSKGNPKQTPSSSSSFSSSPSSSKKNNNIYVHSFDSFWSIWPKKKAKEKALKAWLSLKPDDSLFQKILSDVEAKKDCEDWTKDGRQFCPLPASYLNGKRWEDEETKTESLIDRLCREDREEEERNEQSNFS